MGVRITFSPLAALAGLLAVISILHVGLAAAQRTALEAGDDIRVEVDGQFSRSAGSGADRTGFHITANGISWEVDVSGERLLQTADRLAGGRAVVTGTYRETRDGRRVRRVVTAQAIARSAGRGEEHIDVTMRGVLKSGIMAIGAETTGVTITSGGVTWELELDGNQRQVAGTSSGSTVVVSGQLRQQRGVEVGSRSIVQVRSIQSLN